MIDVPLATTSLMGLDAQELKRAASTIGRTNFMLGAIVVHPGYEAVDGTRT